mmetsp:Transcript_2313/g.4840  ORF Transcript_2313/g.4840 Transcript_2313/m.4840 type:complete len:374 (-) Transcript_2313:27-1148(-)
MRRQRLLALAFFSVTASLASRWQSGQVWLGPRGRHVFARSRVHHPEHAGTEALRRREVIGSIGSGSLLAAAAGAATPACAEVFPRISRVSLSERFKPGSIVLENPRFGPLAPPVPSQCVFPEWLFGEWQVKSRQRSFAEPLGGRFLEEEVRKALRADMDGEVLQWKSRFYLPPPEELNPSTIGADSNLLKVVNDPERAQRRPSMPLASELSGNSVVQYRAFNAAQEVQAFLGVRGLEVLAQADPRVQPLKIVVAFPVDADDSVQTISLRLDASGVEADGDSFISSELFRQEVATNGIVENVGDYEVLNRFTLLDDIRGTATVQNRVVQYLVPGDALYEEAAGRGVSLLDYEWNLTRVNSCIQTPYGPQCRTLV